MTAGLNVTDLSPESESAWDALASASDDAWFWQTTDWVKWATVVAGEAFVSGHSFVIANSAREVVGLCPVNIELRGDERKFSMLGGPIPAPAFKNGLGPVEREHALHLYVDTLAAIARRERVVYGSVKMPFTGMLRPGHSAVNPWMRFGFFDLPYQTQVVDLRLSEDALWAGVRKGHRSDIKRAAQRADVHVWDATTVTPAKCREYQALHTKDAGRVTRSQTTFDMMESWIRRGQAVLAESALDGRPIAFAVVIRYKNGAYYASGCRDPEVTHVRGSHAVQWGVMQWLKQHGCELYDVGMQFIGPQWFYLPTPKEVSIAAFKRGFGGLTIPLVTAERFYDDEALRRTFEARITAYLQATADRQGEV